MTTADRGRFWEHAGFATAILIGLLYGVAEATARLGICIGKCTTFDASFPWGLLIVMLILAAPKTLGRMQAGQILGGLLGRIPGRTTTVTTSDAEEQRD